MLLLNCMARIRRWVCSSVVWCFWCRHINGFVCGFYWSNSYAKNYSILRFSHWHRAKSTSKIEPQLCITSTGLEQSTLSSYFEYSGHSTSVYNIPLASANLWRSWYIKLITEHDVLFWELVYVKYTWASALFSNCTILKTLHISVSYELGTRIIFSLLNNRERAMFSFHMQVGKKSKQWVRNKIYWSFQLL